MQDFRKVIFAGTTAPMDVFSGIQETETVMDVSIAAIMAVTIIREKGRVVCLSKDKHKTAYEFCSNTKRRLLRD